MTIRTPLVLADSGMIEQIQVGDTLAGNEGIAQLLIQGNAIIRLLAATFMTLQEGGGTLAVLSDDDVESLMQEITP